LASPENRWFLSGNSSKGGGQQLNFRT
jgi:hypothetical protein